MDNQDKVFIDNLQGDLKKIAEVIGLEPTLKLAKKFRGTHLYIASIDSLLRHLRDFKIRQDFKRGVNIRGLVTKYSLTERQVRRILKGIEESQVLLDSLLDEEKTKDIKK